MLKQA
ncbi:hypothetical protein VTH06DRAFT_2868 [Thermothelomyces fergusii]